MMPLSPRRAAALPADLTLPVRLTRVPLRACSLESLDEIVAAVGRLLERLPFDRIKVSDIVRESGLSAGLLYTRFPSKHTLITYVMERHLANWLRAARFALSLDRPVRSMRIRLRRISRWLDKMHTRSPGLLAAWTSRSLRGLQGRREAALDRELRAHLACYLSGGADQIHDARFVLDHLSLAHQLPPIDDPDRMTRTEWAMRLYLSARARPAPRPRPPRV